MSRTPFFPGTGCGHGPVVPPLGLDAAREKRKAQMMKCGQCRQNFSAICSLHQHLNGDSYHFDKEMMTAYPLEENSCPAHLQNQHSVVGTYETESGVKQITMVKKTHSKTIKKEPGTAKSNRIISIQVYPNDDEDGVDNDSDADAAHVDFEYFGPNYARPKVTTNAVSPRAQNLDKNVNPLSIESQPITVTQVTSTDLDDIAGANFEEITEKQLAQDIKQEIQYESELENDLHEPMHQHEYEPMEQNVHIENDGQEYIANDTGITESVPIPVPISEPIHNVEAVLNVPENPVSEESNADLRNTDSDMFSQDQENEDESQTQEKEVEPQTDASQPSPYVMNKQMVIDLHSLETNDDGSLKIVVGEKHAGIFKTPQGTEILKALKAQGKGLSVKNTQIVYNYSVPISLDGSSDNDLAETNIHIPAISDSPLRSHKHVKREMGSDAFSDQYKKKGKYMRQDDIGEELDMAENIDGVEAVVFMRQEEQITTNEAMSILEEVKLGMYEDKISKIQPLKANGGDLFVVDLEALPSRKDIRHDKYVWHNVGTRKYPKKKERMKKTVFKIRLPDQAFSDGFMKSIYEWIDETERYCIIHYTGYEKIFKPFPHGNCKTGKNFVRTCSSVIAGLKEMASHDDMSPTDVYKQVKGITTPGLRNLRAPRNLDQIKNHFFYQKKRLDKARRAGKAGKNNKTSAETLPPTGLEAGDLVLATSDVVLSPSSQGVSRSLTSIESQAVSLLPSLIQMPSGQTQVVQVSNSHSDQPQYTTISNSQPQIIQVTDNFGQVIQVSEQGQIFQAPDDHDQGQVIQLANDQGQIIQLADEDGQVIQMSGGQHVIQLPDGQAQVIQVSDGTGQAISY